MSNLRLGWLACLAAGWGAAAAAAPLAPRRALDAGARDYAATNYAAAAEQFLRAATNAAAQALDPAVAQYDAGAAYYRLGRMDAAAERLAEALRTDDLSLQERACYNRGNALAGQAAALRQQTKLDEAQQNLTEALSMYERAILLEPNDEAAKVNYELALRLKQEIEQQQKEQQKQQQDQQKQDQPQDKSKGDQQQKQQDKPDQQQQQQQQNQQQSQEEKRQDKSDQQSAAQQNAANGREKKADEMTKEEAQQLLDAMRLDEQAQRDRLPLQLNNGQNQPVEKDW